MVNEAMVDNTIQVRNWSILRVTVTPYQISYAEWYDKFNLKLQTLPVAPTLVGVSRSFWLIFTTKWSYVNNELKTCAHKHKHIYLVFAVHKTDPRRIVRVPFFRSYINEIISPECTTMKRYVNQNRFKTSAAVGSQALKLLWFCHNW